MDNSYSEGLDVPVPSSPPLAEGFEAVELAERVRGMAPANLDAATNTAKPMGSDRAGLEAIKYRR